MTTKTRKRADEPRRPPEADGAEPAAPATTATTATQRPQRNAELHAVALALAAPFDASEVKFKPQTVSGNRALAIPYVDARVIQDRLDDVLGVLNWQDSYEVLPDGAVVCRLKVRIAGEWITKEDVGSESEQPDEGDRRKAAFSDALKRAAVKFGLGRYLYRQKPEWCDYDPQKRRFTRQPVLPASAQPAPRAASHATEATAAPEPPKPQKTLAERLHDKDRALTEEKLCQAGQLVAHVVKGMKADGAPSDMGEWTPGQWRAAGQLVAAFELRVLGDVANLLFSAKGRRYEEGLDYLKLPRTTKPTELTAEQVRKLIAGLRQYPDKSKAS